MAQSRLILKGDHLDIANSIKDITRLGSLSEVVGAMLTRYGKHMLETWEVQPNQVSQPSPSVPAMPQSLLSPADVFPDNPPTDPGNDLDGDDFL